MLEDIKQRYSSMKTAKGHDVRVDDGHGGVVIWFSLDIEVGEPPRPCGIAKVTFDGGKYSVQWIKGSDTIPTPFSFLGNDSADEYSDKDALYRAIDEELKQF